MVSTRPETEAADNEYESFLAQGGLRRDDLHHVPLEEVDFLDSFAAGDVSGILIGGAPYDASTPETAKTRTRLRAEEQVRELLAVALKEGIPLLATGFGLEVLAGYLGTQTSPRFGEEPGAADVFLTAEGRQDPVLAGMPQTFTSFVGHTEGAVEVPPHATLLASSPDCPVQMIRVGTNVYGTQFNPELDAERFAQRLSIYADAGYGEPGMIEDVVAEARSIEQHVAGRIIRNFASHFARD
ncbi:GMP synthase [glutamine-hydrolyzing] [Actinomyces howellii]|uniref:GMP synthase [glutamine-hydrolyzing] n=2 Tax=Actinomyces howellii TaxID=52771 RepID=A0A448HIF1_9ACTO|nr:GMP synthase [glutamine-hydrolyzing] [Actinomyces howellii]